ncbi:MAG: hypothetical protein KDE28_00820 [Anaerolineales bacterium]|nr:hypothetical protein [Anaerolineales bacterium]
MPEFHYQFDVAAPAGAVNKFHHDSKVLQQLSPLPVFVQLHQIEPLAEGSLSQMTMWVGPIPLRWHARHENVSDEGFTDVQERGPMALWRHTHRFIANGPERTTVQEHVQYEHPAGFRGLLTRLLFNSASLYLLFTYRQIVTRLALRRQAPAPAKA